MKSDEMDLSGGWPEGPEQARVMAVEGDSVAPFYGADEVAATIAFEPVVSAGATPTDVPGELETAVEVVAEEARSSPPARGASTDVVPEIYPRRWRWPRIRLGRKAAAVLVALLVLAFSGVAYATYDYDRNYDGKLLPGIEIAGIDVGGMTPKEALRAVTAAGKIQLDRSITVRYKEKRWEITPRELGARSNARQLVEAAVAASDDTGVLKKVGMALFGGRLDHQREIGITTPRQGIKGFVEGVATSLDREPIEAGVDYSTGWLEFIEPKEGRTVLRAKSRRALARALETKSERVVLRVRTTQPEVAEAKWDKVLLLRIGENKLYLYEDGKITHEYVVATGQPEYPTPTGEYYITEKRYMPTWVNPDPEGWGAGMPLSIGPGPGNPLGTRALNWSASGIRFHGTEATYSLGYNASHGCVRMSMPDVEELYELVDVGTPIVSLVASPLDPMYTSSPDPGPAN